ncbi:WXG100 family type VII secretion target [Microbacterium halophytorum]|uniref:WXG100 family type VII secretion target n=1 Tax=Microbacterium halophytorum TaxID=2067568 RepID=UPI000CFC8B38|nr:WXG100 family type VII secretion target [Microbacterium halophytorum]
MPVYTVDSEEIQTKSAAVQATVGRVQSETAALQGQLADLQRSWTGQAAAAFQVSADNWRSVQLRVDEALAALGNALAIAGTGYAEAEQSAASMFR